MVLSGHSLPNGGLHQPRQGREDVDGGVDLGGAETGSGRRQGANFPLLPASTCLPSPPWFSWDWSLFIPQEDGLVTRLALYLPQILGLGYTGV